MRFCPTPPPPPQFFGLAGGPVQIGLKISRLQGLQRVQNLKIRLSSFKQVSVTCEYERSHLCYIMKTFKDISVAKIAKVKKGCKIRLSSFKGIQIARGAKVAKRVAKVAKS